MTAGYAPVRFPATEETATTIALIRQAQDAEAITISAGKPRAGLLALLPAFVDGTNIRITWDTPRAIVIENNHLRVSWRVYDRSFGELAGQVMIDAATTGIDVPDIGRATIDVSTFSSGHALKHRISRLARDAHHARWTLLMALSPFVAASVHRACVRVATELAGDRSSEHPLTLLSPEEQQSIVDEVLVGHTGDSSIAIRLIARVAGDQKDHVGDSRRYIARNLESACETAVRRRVGDPHTGRIIRQAARDLGTTNPVAIVAELRHRSPRARIGMGRVEAALTVASSPHVGALALNDAEHLPDRRS